MRTALHRHAGTTTASASTLAEPLRAVMTPQKARPAPTHDITGLPIADVAQRKPATGDNAAAYRAPNRTGLPDRLKAGVEARSGLSLDRVRVHTNSSQPAQLNAHAFTRGTDIHVAPGQARHLAHEAWHVVQQAQGRVQPTAQTASGVRINDDPALEGEADRFQTDLGSAGSDAAPAFSDGPVAQPGSPAVVQRNVMVGADVYKPYGRNGLNPDGLIRTVAEKRDEKKKAGTSLSLRMGWQTDLRDEATDTSKTTPYKDWDEVLDTFKSDKGAKKRERLEEQDATITKLVNSPTIDEPTRKRARIMAYESEKALNSLLEHIEGTDEYDDTKTELESLDADKMDDSVATEVTKTTSSAFVYHALKNSKKVKRLDFNFHKVPLRTHGYETPGDRTKDASTLPQAYGHGTVMVGGKDLGAYRKIVKAKRNLSSGENRALTSLEMLRIPQSSAMTGLKRDLYEKRKIDVSEAMAIDSPKSNVEFTGAVSGSGLTKDPYGRMLQQQTLSNAMILDDYTKSFPNFEIGAETRDKKPRATPKEISDTLSDYFNLIDKTVKPKKKLTKAERKKLTAAKQKVRRKLGRSDASVLEVENYESDQDVSDFEDSDY